MSLLLFSSSLMRNPVTTKKFYRLYVINKLPQVRLLDFQKVRLKVRSTAMTHLLIGMILHYVEPVITGMHFLKKT